MRIALAWIASLVGTGGEPAELPLVVVDQDDVVVERSCRLRFVDERLHDAADDGVVRITGSGITVEAEGHLRGTPRPGLAEPAPEALTGLGIVVTGTDVTLRGARVSGFRVGVMAEGADGLVLEDADVSGNFAQRLDSTPWAEDPTDWLWPHANDGGEWLRNYGAGIAVREAEGVTVRRCLARRGQNGLVLDGVTGGRVYDNDFSFLSGWGIAMWRSSRNAITRNALDFCIRGYSHGVYNRGQDSAGLLMFEQCSQNLVAENSATHSGDGFFVFAGKQALGDVDELPEGFDATRRGCNDNWFVANDLSWAAAHGLEVTFSFGNRILGNRFVGNAICGIWGGYSRDTIVLANTFEANGDAGYGLERGGVNAEHAQRFQVVGNRFQRNRCGVHLWDDEDAAIAATPWAAANGTACADNVVATNAFTVDEVGLHLRDAVRTAVGGNAFSGVGEPRLVEGPEPVAHEGPALLPPEVIQAAGVLGFDGGYPDALPDGFQVAGLEVVGVTRPVGARRDLAGRERIVVTERGPHAWTEPLLRLVARGEGGDRWELVGSPAPLRLAPGPEGEFEVVPDSTTSWTVVPRESAGDVGRVLPYAFEVTSPVLTLRAEGTLVDLTWSVRAFAWETDPREDEERWRAEADAGVGFTLRGALDLPFGGGGPARFAGDDGAGLPSDRFGILATTRVALPAGRHRVVTVSDDGLRLWADGELLVDDWTWHAPRRHEAEVLLDEPREVELRVEHFELDGHAVLSVELEPDS